MVIWKRPTFVSWRYERPQVEKPSALLDPFPGSVVELLRGQRNKHRKFDEATALINDLPNQFPRMAPDEILEKMNILLCSYSPDLACWFSNSTRTWSSNSVKRLFGAGTIPRCELYIVDIQR